MVCIYMYFILSGNTKVELTCFDDKCAKVAVPLREYIGLGLITYNIQ